MSVKNLIHALKGLKWQHQLNLLEQSADTKTDNILFTTEQTKKRFFILDEEEDQAASLKNEKLKWREKWIKSLSKKTIENSTNNALTIHAKRVATILDAYKLFNSAKGNTFLYEIAQSANAGMLNIFEREEQKNTKIGTIKVNGFKPTKEGKGLWQTASRIATGKLSEEERADLSKPALRGLNNTAYALNESAGIIDATRPNEALIELESFTKETKNIFGTIKNLNADLLLNPWSDPSLLTPDFGGVYEGKTWVLTQASPSITGGHVPGSYWFGTVDGGQAHEMASDPLNRDNIITHLAHAGLWHSQDGGQTWEQISDQNRGANAAPNNFSHLAAYNLPGEAQTLMLAFVGGSNYQGIGGRNNDGSLNTLVSTNSGQGWTRNTDITGSTVADSLQLSDQVILADGLGIKIFDTSNGWQQLLRGNPESTITLENISQLKEIPGNNSKIIARAENSLYLVDLVTRTTSPISLPNPVVYQSSYSEIDTADLGDSTFRLYYFGVPHKDLPSESGQPSVGTVYSIDLDKGLTSSNISNVDASGSGSAGSNAWTAWGYPETDNDGTTIFRNSVLQALGDSANWFHTLELLADPSFPDKVYVGGTTLGYILHPSVETDSPKERAVNLHWDPAGWNTYVREEWGSVNPGSIGAEDIAQIDQNPDLALQTFINAVELGQDKAHADAQMLFSDGVHLYYGNDGGLNKLKINPSGDTKSITLKAFGVDYTWDQFKSDIANNNFRHPIVRGLESLPALGFYQPNWEDLNFTLITNLYQGGAINSDGTKWIAGSQDNGISIGADPDTSPHRIYGGDGGNGFFGDSDWELAWTNQSDSGDDVTYGLNGELPDYLESNSASLGLWRQSGRRDWFGELQDNLIASLLGSDSFRVKVGSDFSDTTDSIERFFSPDNNGLSELFPTEQSLDSMRKNLAGENDPIEEINFKWVNYRQLSQEEAVRTLSDAISVEGATLNSLLQPYLRHEGQFKLEFLRESGSKEHLDLELLGNPDGSFILGIKTYQIASPHIAFSLDGGANSEKNVPIHSGGTEFYFPAEQHPAKKETIGISNGKRIYVYHDLFNQNALAETNHNYSSTVDLSKLHADFSGEGPSRLTTFAFAPWDQSGQTLLCGFDSGATLLIKNALTTSDAPEIEQIGFGSGRVNAVAFSAPSQNTYTNSNDGFFAISHEATLLPEIIKYKDGEAVRDTNFGTGTIPGSSLDVLIAKENRIYSASTDGVYSFNLKGGFWRKIGGNYSDNLPSTRIANLAYDDATGRLHAFTYGRGVYYYDTKLKLILHPDIETEIWDLPDVYEVEGQYVPPPDLVQMIQRIGNPRILNSVEFVKNRKNNIDLGIPSLPPSHPFTLSKEDLAVQGDWYDQNSNQFLQQANLEEGLNMFAEATIRSSKGKTIKKLSLPATLNPFDGDVDLGQQLTTSNIDLSKAIQFIDKRFGKSYADATILLDYGFKYDKDKQKTYSGRKIITFSGEYSKSSQNIGLANPFQSELDKNRKTLEIFSNGLLDPAQSQALIPLKPFKATVDNLTIIPTPSNSGKISGEIFNIKKNGKISGDPIEKLETNQRNQMWWNPEQAGGFLLKLSDAKKNLLASYELNVKKNNAREGAVPTFLFRFKGFEQNIMKKIDFSSSSVKAFKALPAKKEMASFLKRNKISDKLLNNSPSNQSSSSPDLQGKEALDELSPTNDFLLDYTDLKALDGDKKKKRIFYKSVDWDQVDYAMVTQEAQEMIDWNNINLSEAKESPTFSDASLNPDLFLCL